MLPPICCVADRDLKALKLILYWALVKNVGGKVSHLLQEEDVKAAIS